MASYSGPVDNSPVARANRVAAAGGVRGSTALSQQIVDLDNGVRSLLGLPPVAVPGYQTAPDQTPGQGSPVPAQVQVLPMWSADP